jgi:hypothetical protein
LIESGLNLRIVLRVRMAFNTSFIPYSFLGEDQ